MGIAQYIIYLLGGMSLLFVMGAYLGASAGVGTLGLVMIITPMIIAWICTGLSFFVPRITASCVLALILPYLYVGVANLINPVPASETWVFLVPPIFVGAISIAALLKPAPSLWSRANSIWMRGVIVLFSIAPAAWGVYILAGFVSRITLLDEHPRGTS